MRVAKSVSFPAIATPYTSMAPYTLHMLPGRKDTSRKRLPSRAAALANTKTCTFVDIRACFHFTGAWRVFLKARYGLRDRCFTLAAWCSLRLPWRFGFLWFCPGARQHALSGLPVAAAAHWPAAMYFDRWQRICALRWCRTAAPALAYIIQIGLESWCPEGRGGFEHGNLYPSK